MTSESRPPAAEGRSRSRDIDGHPHDGRERIARDLHDLVSPHLVKVAVELSAVESMIDNSLQHRLRRVIREIDALIATTRQFVFVLPERDGADRPDSLASPTVELVVLVEALLQRAGEQLGAAGRLDVDGRLDLLSPQLARGMGVAATEAIRNVVVHSRATTVTVCLTVTEQTAEVLVADDGRGVPEPCRSSVPRTSRLKPSNTPSLRHRQHSVRTTPNPGSGTKSSLRTRSEAGTDVILAHGRDRSQRPDVGCRGSPYG